MENVKVADLPRMRELATGSKYEFIKRSWYNFSKNKISVVGLTVVILIIFMAIFQKQIAPYPQHAGVYVSYADADLAPCGKFLLGTDQYGRDVLSRIIFSFRGSLIMGIGVLGVAAPIGVVVGLLAGYYNDRVISVLLMRIVDIFLSLPSMILALAVSAMLQPNLFNSMMALTFSWWAWYARLIYGNVTSVRNEYFIQSAELIGASKAHILFNEIFPNCLSTVLTKMTLDMGTVILMGASLSFVGLGEQPPHPALGTMISDGYKLLPSCWWLTVFPAIAILIIVLAFNLLGDGIGDMLSTDEV